MLWLGVFVAEPPEAVALALWFWVGAVAASAGACFGYRYVVTAGWAIGASLPSDRAVLLTLVARPYAHPSLCEGCGTRLALSSKLPLVGWLWGCRVCLAHGGVFHPLAEWLGASALCVAFHVHGAPGAAAVLPALVLWCFCSAADRASLSVPTVAPLALVWLSLLFSPHVGAAAGVTGAVTLFSLLLAVAIARPIGARFAAARERSSADAVSEPGADAVSEPAADAVPEPAADAVPETGADAVPETGTDAGSAGGACDDAEVPPLAPLPFGDGDWIALVAVGAWFGLFPGLLVFVGAAALFSATHRRSVPAPFLPSLAGVSALVFIAHSLGWLGRWAWAPALPWL